jgi:Ricin-type beta-trefoil lectin domain-like
MKTPSLPSALRPRLVRRASAVAAILATVAGVAVAPGVANAQPLNRVAIATDSSAEFLVLDVSGASTSPGAKVIQYYGNGGANQRWTSVDAGNGNQQIVNEHSGQCLTTNGTAGSQLYQWPCTLGARQEWRGTLPQAFNGLQRGSSLVNPSSGLAVDINRASADAGAAAIGWYASDSYNQHFAYFQL